MCNLSQGCGLWLIIHIVANCHTCCKIHGQSILKAQRTTILLYNYAKKLKLLTGNIEIDALQLEVSEKNRRTAESVGLFTGQYTVMPVHTMSLLLSSEQRQCSMEV